jgi:hypothetical protein
MLGLALSQNALGTMYAKRNSLGLPPRTMPKLKLEYGFVALTPSLVRTSCDLSGWLQLVSELGWHQATQARMRSGLVTTSPPFFDAGTGLVQ